MFPTHVFLGRSCFFPHAIVTERAGLWWKKQTAQSQECVRHAFGTASRRRQQATPLQGLLRLLRLNNCCTGLVELQTSDIH